MPPELEGRSRRESADPDADVLQQHGLAALAAVYDEMYADLLRRIADRIAVGAPLDDLLLTAEFGILGFQKALAAVLGDAMAASWLVGAGELASQAAPFLLSGGGSIPPPLFPPVAAEGWDWDGMNVWLPLVENAVERLQSLQLLTRDDYDAASEAIRRDAFTVAGLETERAVGHVRDALTRAVGTGGGLPEFAEDVREELAPETLGIGHVENIMRTGQARVYSDGMEKILEHPVVADGFPYVERLPIEDARETDLCYQLARSGIQGTAIFRVSDPIGWQKYKPPTHFQCRTGRRYMTVEDAAEHGIEEARKWLATGEEPTPPAWVDEPELSEEARKTFDDFHRG